jgi:hypothetical protein
MVTIERDRSLVTRDFHPHPGNEDVDFETEGSHSWNVIQTLPGSSSTRRDLS